MQTLEAKQMLASGSRALTSRNQLRPVFSTGPRRICNLRGLRQLTLRQAVSGGADTLEQRKQEAKEWINAWRGNGSSPAEEEAPSAAKQEAPSAAQSNGATAEEVDDDDDDDFDEDLGYGDEDYEEEDEEGQDPDFEDAPVSEGPFKYNIPNSDKGGEFAPDYTLADGSVIFTSKTLDSVSSS